jgi:hypothetical protein
MLRFYVLLFNNGINYPLTVNPLFNNSIDGSLCFLPEIFCFDFFKIKYVHFGKPSPPMRPSIVFLVFVPVIRRSNLRHPTSTRWSMSYTSLRVDLTRRCMLSTRHPLHSCISGATYPPLPPLSLAYFHLSLLLFILLWVLYFEFLFLFSAFLRVHSTVCNYLSYMVCGELWNPYGSVLLLVSFGCVFVDTPSLTAFIGSQFFWFLHQESIGPHYSFEALSLLFFVYLSYFDGFRSFLFGLSSP